MPGGRSRFTGQFQCAPPAPAPPSVPFLCLLFQCSLPGELLQSAQKRESQKGWAADCYSERSQEPTFRKRGERGRTQGGPGPEAQEAPVPSPALQGLPLSQLLPPSTPGWEAGQGFKSFPSLSCLFWLHVRACLMENKTKEVIS